MRFWIFTTFVHSQNDLELNKLESYFKPMLWGFERRELKNFNVSEGDMAIFYVGGNHARFFVGKAKIASTKPIQINATELFEGYNFILAGMQHGVKLKELELWEPLPIKEVVRELSFCNGKNYGMALAKAFREITKKEFEWVVSQAKKRQK